MSKISELLTEAVSQRDLLVDNLNSKGVTSDYSETFNSLIPKVLDIQGSDTSDATATSSDILLDKTAYVNGVKITGEVVSKSSEIYTPTIISQNIDSGQYLEGDQIILGDEDLLPENIREGIEIFGVIGTYSGSGSGQISSDILIDTKNFTSAQETLDTYGDSIYISESSNSGFITLSDMVERWGELTSQNNYIGNTDSNYGINMANWSESSANTEILFLIPMTLNSGNLLLKINAHISSWINYSLNVHLISAIGNTPEELLSDIESKIAAEDYAYSIVFPYSGSMAKTDVYNKISVGSGTYYLHISGHTKADNSNFTYINVEYFNF